MSEISRRRVVAGAAWTVPAVIVGSAVPAVAASVAGCPQLVSADPPLFFPSKTSATLRLSFSGVVGTPSIQIVAVNGVGFTGPLSTFQIATTTQDITFTRNTSAFGQGDVAVTYRLKNQAGTTCGPDASFTFFYSTVPV